MLVFLGMLSRRIIEDVPQESRVLRRGSSKNNGNEFRDLIVSARSPSHHSNIE